MNTIIRQVWSQHHADHKCGGLCTKVCCSRARRVPDTTVVDVQKGFKAALSLVKQTRIRLFYHKSSS